jgi:VanZ family protein
VRGRTIIVVGFLFAASIALISELITRNGVGTIEYVVSIAVVIGLLLVAARLTLRARRSRPA